VVPVVEASLFVSMMLAKAASTPLSVAKGSFFQN
jgi:hypothetical protein